MSEVEHIRGKLRPTGKTIEEYVGDIELSYPYSTIDEYFRENFYRVATEVEGLVYTIVSENIEPYGDIFNSIKGEDGSYTFEIKYYNGGCGFEEALEEALENCKECT